MDFINILYKLLFALLKIFKMKKSGSMAQMDDYSAVPKIKSSMSGFKR